MALFRIVAATGLLCWAVPDIPRSLLQEFGMNKAGLQEKARDAMVEQAKDLCLANPQRCMETLGVGASLRLDEAPAKAKPTKTPLASFQNEGAARPDTAKPDPKRATSRARKPSEPQN